MNYPWQETVFLTAACRTVIECRNVLKWTYAIAFFKGKEWNASFKHLFETWQQDLEKFTDHIHEELEKPLDQYVNPTETDRTPFYRFRDSLITYYESTKRFREHLIAGIDEARNNGTT